MDRGKDGKKGKGSSGDSQAVSPTGAKDFKDILNAKFENAIKMHDQLIKGESGNQKKEKEQKEKKEGKEKDKERERKEEKKREKKEREKKDKDKEREKEGKEKEKENEKDRDKRDKRASSANKGGRVFGGFLKEGLYDKKGTKHPVPPFFDQALTFIEERGMLHSQPCDHSSLNDLNITALETPSLFQETGSKKDVKELVKRIEARQDIEWNKIKNPSVVSSA